MRGVGVAWKVDLAGFTPFLEAREGRGREGAEEVAVAVARTFLPLLHQVREAGGTVLGFGGDALTAWFPLHPRETFQRFARGVAQRIERSPLPLRARQLFQRGVIQVHLLPFPDPSRTFPAYTGPALHVLARREKTVAMGDIWFHPRLPSAPSSTRPFTPPPPWVPDRLRDEPSRFQPLTAVFVEVSRRDRTSLRRTFQNLTQALQALDGHLIKGETTPAGFRWLVVFGFPFPLEDAVERVRDLAAVLSHPRVRMGAASGIAVNVRLGPFVDFMGDTLNTAARICAATPWGACWIGGEGHRTLTLKGKRRTVTVISARETPMPSGSHLPLIGRDNELRVLRDTLRAFSAGGTPAVSLVGPPGVGKTRLLQAFLEEAALLGIPFVHVRVAQRPYPAWALIRRLLLQEVGQTGYVPLRTLRELRRRWNLPPHHLPALNLLLNQRDVAPEASRWIPEMLHRIFQSLPRRLWIVEDAQWVEPTSRRFLTTLPDLGHGVLWVARDTGEPFNVDREIRVRPLSPDAMTHLVRRLLPEGGPVEAIVQRAQGIPLYALEMARAWREGGTWLTPRLETLIQSRLLRLPLRMQRALQAAAVYGDGMPLDLLHACVPEVQEDDLKDLDRRGFYTVSRGRGRFHHDLIREAVYAGMLLRKRRKWHRQMARLLEARYPDHLEEIGYHWKRGGNLPRAARVLHRAARRAADRRALEEAQTLFEEARTCYPDSSPFRYIVAWDAREVAFWIRGDMEGLHRELAQVRRDPEWNRHTPVRVYLALRACSVAMERGETDPLATLKAIAPLIPGMPRDLQVQYHHQRGALAHHLGDHREALVHFIRAFRLCDDPVQRIWYLTQITRPLHRLGWSRHALRWLQALRSCLPEDRITTRIHLLNTLANLWKDLGHFPEARKTYEEALKLAQHHSAPYRLAMLLGNLASLEENMGLFREAVKHYRESIALFQETGHLRGEAYMVGSLGIVEKYTGDLTASRRHLLHALRLARRLQHHVLVIRYLNALGGWYALQHRPDRARRLYRTALGCHPGPLMEGVVHLNLALLALDTGHVSSAREHLQRVRAALHRLGTMPLLEGYRDWAEARLLRREGRDREAWERLHRAHRTFRSLHHAPGRFFAGVTRAAWEGCTDWRAFEAELQRMGAGPEGELGHFLARARQGKPI